MSGAIGYRRPVVIAGAGLGGLVTAVAVQRAGFSPLIVEKQPHLPYHRTGVALWANAIRVLDRLGVGTKLRTHGLPTTDGHITDSARGRVLHSFNLSDETRGLITEIIVAEESEVKQILLEELPVESVLFNSELMSFTQHEDRVDVEIKGLDTIQASVLVGADGPNSRVRSKLRLPSSNRYAGYTTWRGVADFQDDHGDFPMGLGREAWGPGKRFGTMLIRKGTVYWYAVANAKSGELFLRPFKRTLLDKFSNWPHRCTDLIEATKERDITRFDVQERLMPASWVSNRVALIGEAAHPITPNMHQGTCIALEDAYCLGQMIAEYGVRDSLGLEMYERHRRPRTLEVAQRSWRVGRFAQWENPLACWLRSRLLGNAVIASSLRRSLRLIGDYTAGDLPGPFLRG